MSENIQCNCFNLEARPIVQPWNTAVISVFYCKLAQVAAALLKQTMVVNPVPCLVLTFASIVPLTNNHTQQETQITLPIAIYLKNNKCCFVISVSYSQKHNKTQVDTEPGHDVPLVPISIHSETGHIRS